MRASRSASGAHCFRKAPSEMSTCDSAGCEPSASSSARAAADAAPRPSKTSLCRKLSRFWTP